MKKFIILTALMLLLIPHTYAKAASSAQTNGYQMQYINLDWWERYNDPILTEHLKKLYQNNNDLKITSLKVKEGEKLVKISFANELPQAGISGQMARVFTSSDLHYGSVLIPDYAQNNFYFPLTMSYEVDLWGTNRTKTKSMQKRLEMIKQDEKAGYIAISSAFAADYFNLVKVDKLIEIQKELIASQKQITDAMEKKHANGLCPITIVIEEQKALTFLEEELNNLEEKQDALTNQMSVYLSDRDSANLTRTKYENLQMLENLPQEIGSDAIQNRPDMIKAEKNLQRAGLDVKVAKKNFLPKFVLVGEVGFNAYNWSKFFSSTSQLANAGILPSVDLFSGGRKMAILKLRKDEYEEAIQYYQKTTLTSLQELNDSLVSLKIAQKNYKVIENRENLEKKEFDLMSQKNTIGAAADIDTLFFRQKVLLAQKNEVSSKINCLISSIALYKAVGGKDLYVFSQNNL
jgi:NodT family efflux transporter outer membrane factor (OMF) lipoprotein